MSVDLSSLLCKLSGGRSLDGGQRERNKSIHGTCKHR